jgi:hypothetical protein
MARKTRECALCELIRVIVAVCAVVVLAALVPLVLSAGGVVPLWLMLVLPVAAFGAGKMVTDRLRGSKGFPSEEVV